MAAWVGHGAARVRPGLLAKRLGPCLGNGSGVAGSAVTPHGVDHAISNASRQQRAVIRCRPGSAMGRRRTLHRNRTGQSAAIGWLRRPSSRSPGADRSGNSPTAGSASPAVTGHSCSRSRPASGSRSSEASPDRRPPAWAPKAASPSHQGAAGLRDALAGGALDVAELEVMARASGLLGERQRISSAKGFKRAKESLGIKSVRSGFGTGGGWLCELPSDRDEGRRHHCTAHSGGAA
jgi:hypothetical protein